MTTEALPTMTQFVAMRLARRIERSKAREANNHVRPWFQTVLRLVFHLAGFGSLTYGAFYWQPVAGFVVMGLSFFALSWLTTSQRVETPGPTTPPNHSWATGDRRG